VTLRPCLTCGRPTRGTRCAEHTVDRGYATVHWQVIRGARLALDRLACQLRHDGCTRRATQVHLDPSLRGDHSRASLELTLSCCAHCHGVEDGRRGSYDELAEGGVEKISRPIASPNDPARSKFLRTGFGS
jgi:hypothetical protein